MLTDGLATELLVARDYYRITMFTPIQHSVNRLTVRSISPRINKQFNCHYSEMRFWWLKNTVANSVGCFCYTDSSVPAKWRRRANWAKQAKKVGESLILCKCRANFTSSGQSDCLVLSASLSSPLYSCLNYSQSRYCVDTKYISNERT